jgi:hypothetical protein
MLRHLAVVLTLLLIAGCGPTEPELPTMAGGWEGNISSSSVRLTASERDQQVSGTGNLSSSSTSLAFTVDGTHVYPSVSLIIRFGYFEDVNFTGKFIDENTIAGRLHGSGFNGQDMDLYRE